MIDIKQAFFQPALLYRETACETADLLPIPPPPPSHTMGRLQPDHNAARPDAVKRELFSSRVGGAAVVPLKIGRAHV